MTNTWVTNNPFIQIATNIPLTYFISGNITLELGEIHKNFRKFYESITGGGNVKSDPYLTPYTKVNSKNIDEMYLGERNKYKVYILPNQYRKISMWLQGRGKVINLSYEQCHYLGHIFVKCLKYHLWVNGCVSSPYPCTRRRKDYGLACGS